MFTDMENWAEIRRRVLVDGQSKRSVCREFEIHWDTLQKILDHPEPPGYHRTAPRPRPKLNEIRLRWWVGLRAAKTKNTPRVA